MLIGQIEVSFGRLGKPRVETFSDLQIDEPWGLAAQTHDARLLGLSVDYASNPPLCEWTCSFEYLRERIAETVMSAENLETLESEGEVGLNVKDVALFVFGPEAGKRDGAIGKIADLCKENGPVDRNLPDGHFLSVDSGVIFLRAGEDHARDLARASSEVYASGLEGVARNRQSRHVARVERIKTKVPTVAGDIDAILQGIDVRTASRLPMYAALRPQLELSNGKKK